MDARLWKAALAALALASLGAGYKTENFVVTAPTPELAKEFGEAAERLRRELAIEWLGKPLGNWSQPCPITTKVSPTLGAGGATSFVFDQGEVFGWQMTVQGSRERILDSVLPHEVTHTIFATHFRRPLPRWADEGSCTTVEDSSERNKQQQWLVQFLKTGRGISFSQMFAMREYPSDIMPLYAQGHSVATYLIHQGGRRKFLDYVADGLRDENWAGATRKYYGFAGLGALQNSWLDWVRQGSPLPIPGQGELAAATSVGSPADRGSAQSERDQAIFRGQSADPPTQPLDAASDLVPVRRPSGGAGVAALAASNRADGAAEPQVQLASAALDRPPNRRVILEWSKTPGTEMPTANAGLSSAPDRALHDRSPQERAAHSSLAQSEATAAVASDAAAGQISVYDVRARRAAAARRF